MLVVGIDPGKKGAISLLDDNNRLEFRDISDLYDSNGAAKSSINPEKLFKLIDSFIIHKDRLIIVGCEKPIFLGARFTIQTTMSMFESYGVLKSAFSYFDGACGSTVRFHGILPREWIHHYPSLYHPKKKREKRESVEEAKALFPSYAGSFTRSIVKGSHKGGEVLLDGRAEAALIAKYTKDMLVIAE